MSGTFTRRKSCPLAAAQCTRMKKKVGVKLVVHYIDRLLYPTTQALTSVDRDKYYFFYEISVSKLKKNEV